MPGGLQPPPAHPDRQSEACAVWDAYSVNRFTWHPVARVVSVSPLCCTLSIEHMDACDELCVCSVSFKTYYVCVCVCVYVVRQKRRQANFVPAPRYATLHSVCTFIMRWNLHIHIYNTCQAHCTYLCRTRLHVFKCNEKRHVCFEHIHTCLYTHSLEKLHSEQKAKFNGSSTRFGVRPAALCTCHALLIGPQSVVGVSVTVCVCVYVYWRAYALWLRTTHCISSWIGQWDSGDTIIAAFPFMRDANLCQKDLHKAVMHEANVFAATWHFMLEIVKRSDMNVSSGW